MFYKKQTLVYSRHSKASPFPPREVVVMAKTVKIQFGPFFSIDYKTPYLAAEAL